MPTRVTDISTKIRVDPRTPDNVIDGFERNGWNEVEHPGSDEFAILNHTELPGETRIVVREAVE